MTLIEHWQDLSKIGKQRLADNVGSSKDYLSQIAHGHRQASPELARQIERATGGLVTRIDLRPDLFGPISASPASC